MSHLAPQARQDGLVVEELPDEVLIYDTERHKAHCLNPAAAVVWKHCDGRNSVGEISRLLESELHTPASEDVVWHALEHLSRRHLLQARVERPVSVPRLTRREMLRHVGVAAGVALVTTIAAPYAAQAASKPCGNFGDICFQASDCCPEFKCIGTPFGTRCLPPS
jgi:hypothetical protein